MPSWAEYAERLALDPVAFWAGAVEEEKACVSRVCRDCRCCDRIDVLVTWITCDWSLSESEPLASTTILATILRGLSAALSLAGGDEVKLLYFQSSEYSGRESAWHDLARVRATHVHVALCVVTDVSCSLVSSSLITGCIENNMAARHNSSRCCQGCRTWLPAIQCCRSVLE